MERLALPKVNDEVCTQQRGDNWACDSGIRTVLGVRRKPFGPCRNDTFAPVSPWALAQGLGTRLSVMWVCTVAAAKNPYWGNVCFAQGAVGKYGISPFSGLRG